MSTGTLGVPSGVPSFVPSAAASSTSLMPAASIVPKTVYSGRQLRRAVDDEELGASGVGAGVFAIASVPAS